MWPLAGQDKGSKVKYLIEPGTFAVNEDYETEHQVWKVVVLGSDVTEWLFANFIQHIDFCKHQHGFWLITERVLLTMVLKWQQKVTL